jgi:hypothetical protein
MKKNKRFRTWLFLLELRLLQIRFCNDMMQIAIIFRGNLGKALRLRRRGSIHAVQEKDSFVVA